MTDIRITGNGKPHYHFFTSVDMSAEEINKHLADNLFRVAGVVYEVTTTTQRTNVTTKSL